MSGAINLLFFQTFHFIPTTETAFFFIPCLRNVITKSIKE